MAKNEKKPTAPDPEVEVVTQPEEGAQPDTVVQPAEAAPPPQAIVPAPVFGNALAVSLGDNNELFMSRYSKELQSVSQEMPNPEALQRIIDGLPEEFVDKISGILRKATGHKKGIYSQDDRPDLPELRIYHGTGNDPNRPENQIPGEYYLTTKENLGKQFIGTVLLVYTGRTMWGSSESGEQTRMPICSSMDRKIGTTYGECETCPHRPWKDGKQQGCSNDVVAYMLAKNLQDIIIVRFAKTSEPTGRQLTKFVKRSINVWSRWYKIMAESRTSPQDRNRRWFVMTVEPVEGEYVPAALTPFCDAMCTILEASAILPSIAQQYRQAKQAGITRNSSANDTPVLLEDSGSDYGEGVTTSAADENM